jgi:hypothetical protein
VPGPQAARIETITADVIAVEHEEAALVWLALDQGLTVEHRVDIGPQALLGVSASDPIAQQVRRPRPTWPGGFGDDQGCARAVSISLQRAERALCRWLLPSDRRGRRLLSPSRILK